jgi:hypothetical protein
VFGATAVSVDWTRLASAALADVALIYAVLRAYRWIHARSRVLAYVVASAVLGRAVLGVALFVISLFEWPILPSLQVGGGFWVLAADARGYFAEAVAAVHHGVGSVPDGSGSPAYVRALALWMLGYGISPASAVLMNVACFVATASLAVIGSAGRTAIALIPVIAVAYSPALVIFSTQPLKDAFCVLALAVLLLGMWLWSSRFTEDRRPTEFNRPLIGVACMTLAVYVLAGIRPYMGVFIIAAAGVAALPMLIRMRHLRLATACANALLLLALCAGFRLGAPDYFGTYLNSATAAVTGGDGVLRQLDVARTGFVATGGATSIAPAPVRHSKAGERKQGAGSASEGSVDGGVTSRLRQLLSGIVALFVPISLARSLGLISFEGGRGLLFITDLDTLFMDALLAAALYLAFRGRTRPWADPTTLFTLALFLSVVLSMAYVVTNFGTLFRLRLLVSVPVWLLPAFQGTSVLRTRPGLNTASGSDAWVR